MNNTTVNYAPSHSTLSSSTTAAPAAVKQIATRNAAKAPAKAEVFAAAPVVKADETRRSTAGALVTKALSLSDVRTEKVAGLQKSISDGTYKVPSSDVAGKLLQSLLG